MTLQDIANWVTGDYLRRSDIQAIVCNAVIDVYRTVCAKIPFDQLMATSPELSVVSGTDTYDLTSGATTLSPALRAIASIRMTFSSTNRRRLRRSHVRVYDSLSFTTAGFVATYARWGNSIQLNPPPDSSSYTFRVRYWSRPTLGPGLFAVSNAAWSSGVATLTLNTLGTGTSTTAIGDQIVVSGVNPLAFNTIANVTAVNLGALTLSYNLPNNPGAYVSGGLVANNQLTAIITPDEWSELYKYETLYRIYQYLDQQDKAMMMVQPQAIPRQATPKKLQMYEVGILPRLWNDLLTTVSQQENTDEDFSINPVIRAYSYRGR